MTSDSTGSGRDIVEQLAESFQARLRRGERPSLEEYVARCPERADDIRELFPALVELEQLKPLAEEIAGLVDLPLSSAEPRAGPELHHPQRLGDYRILRVIGSGGMGVVYEAEHESLKNRVALKVMHPRFRTDPIYLRRFHTEARSAARLHHTNIVPVFDYGEQEGICYYAMPLIAGVGLHQVLEDVRRLRATDDPKDAPEATGQAGQSATEPVAETLRAVTQGLLTGRFSTGPATPAGSDPPPTMAVDDRPREATNCNGGAGEVIASAPSGSDSRSESHTMAGQSEAVYHKEIARLAGQVADALDYAHRQGVVHRDIKPSNLLLDAQGNVWVTDFGLAKFVEGDDLSQSHDLVGTLRFMAPERFRGVTDRRADIYAVGATLYEMLALRPAFAERDHIQLIDQISHLPPVPLRQLDRRIPRDLETIVQKALAKDPKDRFTSAGELRDELRRFLESRPIRSRPISASEQLWRWCKRNPALATANITAAILMTLLAIGSTIAAWTYYGQSNQLRFEQILTKANLSRAEHAEHKAQLALGQSLVSEGAALQRTGLIGQRIDSLDRLAQAAQDLGADSEGRKRLLEIRNLAITALGLTDLRNVQRREIGPVMAVACDPTLERYAVTELLTKDQVGGQAVVRSMADDRELLLVRRPRESFSWAWPAFSPDGQYLVIVYGLLDESRDLIDIWHLGRKESVFRQRSIGWGQNFHPDGRRVIFRPTEKELALWDLKAGRETKRLPLSVAPASVCLDPDGRRVAVSAAGASRKVEIMDLDSGRVLATWVEDVGNGEMCWSRDGRLLAMGNDDGRVLVWDVERGSLTSVLQLQQSGLVGGRFSPTGHLFATHFGGSIQIWNASSGELIVTATIGEHRSFSNDGRRLSGYDGTHLDIWEIAQSHELLTLNPSLIGNGTKQRHRGLIHAAQFSPDGRLVAIATEETAYLLDGRDGGKLAQLNVGYCMTVLFDRDGRNLITYSDRGLFRWLIRDDPAGGHDALGIGPPVLLQEKSSTSRYKACWLPDWQTLAMVDKDNFRVLLVDNQDPHPARKRARALVTPLPSRMISIAASPDGQWAAAGGWNDAGVYVWDLPRRRLEKILPRGDSPADGHTLVAFSPDGRWLVSAAYLGATGYGAGSGYYFWETGTWKRELFVPFKIAAGWGEPVFSPDGAMIAFCHAPNQVRLAEVATGRTIAHLSTLEPLALTPLAFSRDGSRLVAATNRLTTLIWDLRRIRDQLRTMGLDWDAPSLTPEEAPPGGLPTGVRSIRVIGEALEPAARRAAELVEMNRRLVAKPDDAEALIHRGWLFTRQKKWPDAVADLERGLHLRPDDTDALYMLAVSYFQTNRLPAARATLENYLARCPDDVDAHVLKGQVALRLGQLQEAVDDFSKVLYADPKSRDPVRYSRAQIWVRLGKFQDALADLDVLIKRFPQDPALYELRAQVHDRLGHRE